jgi:putative oxidoreductase
VLFEEKEMARSSVSKQNVALGVVRMIVGLVFVLHGAQKLFVYHYAGVVALFHQIGIPAPALSAALAIAAELGGGLLLLTGLYTRLAAVPVAFTMLVAITQVHLHAGFFAQNGGFEYPLTMLVVNLALIIGGGGAFALDNLRARQQLESYSVATAKAA